MILGGRISCRGCCNLMCLVVVAGGGRWASWTYVPVRQLTQADFDLIKLVPLFNMYLVAGSTCSKWTASTATVTNLTAGFALTRYPCWAWESQPGIGGGGRTISPHWILPPRCPLFPLVGFKLTRRDREEASGEVSGRRIIRGMDTRVLSPAGCLGLEFTDRVNSCHIFPASYPHPTHNLLVTTDPTLGAVFPRPITVRLATLTVNHNTFFRSSWGDSLDGKELQWGSWMRARETRKGGGLGLTPPQFHGLWQNVSSQLWEAQLKFYCCGQLQRLLAQPAPSHWGCQRHRRENWLFCGPSVQCISDVPPMCRSVSHSFSCSHLLLGLPLPYILMWKG